MSDTRVSNRDRHLAEQRAKVKKMETGDIVAEMIEIGNPNSIHTAHRKQTVQRFEMLKKELNVRIRPAIEAPEKPLKTDG